MNSIVTVVTPATVTALTTLERVKLELSISDSASDELLLAKIEEASSDIAIRVSPWLKRETVTETFYPDAWHEHAGSLPLRRYPVSAIVEHTVQETIEEVLTDVVIPGVVVDGVGLDTTEYRFNPENGLLFRQAVGGYPYCWTFCQSVAVTYDGGYLLPGQENRNLPRSLEAACIRLVASYWASRGRDPNIKAEENVGVYRFEYWVGAVGEAGDLPPEVMSMIEPYLRRGAFA